MSASMHRFGLTLAVLAVSASSSLVSGSAHAQACGPRVVPAIGETLRQIANRCGVTVEAIMAINPLIPSPNLLVPGLPIQIPPPPPPPPPPVDAVRYTVRPGDTVFSIARASGMTADELSALNPGLDPRDLRAGDVILVRAGALPPPPPAGANIVSYVVQRGDTVASIARANGMTMRQMFELNPDLDARTMRAGDVVQVRGGIAPPAPPADTVRYTVRRGDTLASIARAQGVTRDQLRALNPNVDFRSLRVGTTIRVPAAAAPPPPSAGATVTLSLNAGAPGTLVKVSASGFTGNAPVRLLAGVDASTLRELQRVTTDAQGRASLTVRIPDWAAGQGSLVFAYETTNGRLRSVSPPFRVTPAGAQARRISVVGTLTREGVECQAMRGDDGVLYTLAGSIQGFIAGDRVRVDGRTAEVSTCAQGTTIDVTSIQDAP